MTLAQLLNRPCTITRCEYDENDVDELGNPEKNETTVDTVCELQQRQRGESTATSSGQDAAGATQEISATSWLLILPADTEIDTGDTVTIDDLVYEVAGEPWVARNPRTQALSHIEATVVRTSGPQESAS